jgi:hypothetical protein
MLEIGETFIRAKTMFPIRLPTHHDIAAVFTFMDHMKLISPNVEVNRPNEGAAPAPQEA